MDNVNPHHFEPQIGEPKSSCNENTQERIEQHVPNKQHLIGLLRSKQLGMKQRMATTLVHFLKPGDLASAYVAHGGLKVLLDMLCGDPGLHLQASTLHKPQQRRAAEALAKLAGHCRAIEQGNSSSFIPNEPEKQARVQSFCPSSLLLNWKAFPACFYTLASASLVSFPIL